MATAAASSSSVVASRWKYDVFLSFRGSDTRDNITSHLYDALLREKIRTFMDDQLERGGEIAPSILRTIEESRISVVIFSENYASSPWCLDELVKIIQCKERYGQIVLPVFYRVDPSVVQEQKGSFRKAFAKHRMTFKGNTDKVERWRLALTNAANISGWDSNVIRPDSKLVHGVVQKILKKLNYASTSDSRGLVGMNSGVKQIERLLGKERPIVRTIGIWGMGGIGKTTLAGAAFNCISSQYEASCFLSNVREESEKNNGLYRLRKKLFSTILNVREEDLQIDTPCIGSTLIKQRLNCKKILIVFDDISDVDQFQFLCGGDNFFGAGSRIIATSRDKQVLMNVVDDLYEVQELNHLEALQLFCRTAFKQSFPPEEYMELSAQATKYAGGNPLALKVLGSFLYGRSRQTWEAAVNETGRIFEPKVHSILRTSFEALNDNEKNIFLDIACFFKGQKVDFARDILDGCGFSTETGLCVLVDRCLITISNDKIEMHDLIQEMAHRIVEQESPKEIGKRSRVWNPWDVYQVLVKNLGSEKIEGIFLDVSQVREMNVSSRAFARMHNLRLLRIYNSENRLHLPQGLKYISDELRYLDWNGYPLSSLPSKFLPENLVVLNLSFSKVKQLWNGDQNLINLKEINLSNCKQLIALPEMSRAINLETMILQYCSRLEKVPQVGSERLMDIDLKHCTNLVSLPGNFHSRAFNTFTLLGCSNIKKCPMIKGNLKYLNFNETSISELHPSVGELGSLVSLNLKDCKQLVNLPDDIHSLECLVIFNLSGCSNLTTLPDISRNIKYLYLSGSAIQELPPSIGHLSSLSYLDLVNCKRLQNLPSTISKLASLVKLMLSGCSTLTKIPDIPTSIQELYLDGTAIEEIPSSICRCSKLRELHLQNCRRFRDLPNTISRLKSLYTLDLSGCSSLRFFPSFSAPMKCLRYIHLDGTAISSIPWPITSEWWFSSRFQSGSSTWPIGLLPFPDTKIEWFSGLESASYFDHLKLLEIGGAMKYLHHLRVNGCGGLSLPDDLCLSSVEALDLSGSNHEIVCINSGMSQKPQYIGLRYNPSVLSLRKRRHGSLSELPTHSGRKKYVHIGVT